MSAIAARTLSDRGDEVGPGPLLEPEQGEQELEHRQHPEAADRDPRQVRVAESARAALRRSARRRAARSAPPTVATRRAPAKEVATTARRVLVVLVVEAQQRLDQAEADDDAGGDDGGEHHLGGAVVGRWSGSACRAAAARPRSASRRCSPPCRRRRSSPGGAGIRTRADPTRVADRGLAHAPATPDGQQHPGDRVLEEAGVGHRVDEQGDEGREDSCADRAAREGPPAAGAARRARSSGRRPRSSSRALSTIRAT